MEEEGGIRVMTTRRRARMSIEQSSDDIKSSPAPSTPTIKRGGKRVPKSELDLIEENAPISDIPKKSARKTAAKDTELEEKTLTPSRRSTRIKSNTSLVLETTLNTESPRAKRVTRRNSQIGSDNEAPLTPIRQTRKTRKDSTSNAENAETQLTNKPVVPMPEVIVEELESSFTQSNPVKTVDENQSPSKLRKSPRLNQKTNKSNDSIESMDANKEYHKEMNNSEEHNNSNKENEKIEDETRINNIMPKNTESENFDKKNRLSAASEKMIKELDSAQMKQNSNLNKSSPALTDNQIQSFKHKRYRTKSCTTLAEPISKDNKCYSDSESGNKKKSKLHNSLNNSFKILTLTKLNEPIKTGEADIVDSPFCKDNQNLLSSSIGGDPSPTECLFSKEPTNDMKTLVYIEESDSNSERQNAHKTVEDEDQCVPEVKTQDKLLQIQQISTNISKKNYEINEVNENEIKNNSCEPMDIDESIPDNVMSNQSILQNPKTSFNKVEDLKNEDSIKEKNKSRKSSSSSQSLEQTENENKSTIILSQLKDLSNENNSLQSPQIQKKLSKSENALDIPQDNEEDKKGRSLNYLTSTPLQQNKLIKLAMQVNASGISANNTSKVEKSSKDSKITKSGPLNISNNSSDEESSSVSVEESSQEEGRFIDGEAEEASDDYESGDSRDEEEKKYERDHEILQKGETLTSEEELSDDSDYEKDSFVISSDEEDEDLLDGSGDDLSMSDKELKMTTKSKKKYDERKQKEQKKASREMYESRHQLIESKKSSVSKNSRAIIDSSDSENDIQIKVKKNNRMRLNSSHDTSVNKSLEINSELTKDTRNPSMSKSVSGNESALKEVEITMCDNNVQSEIDPLKTEIKKEPKTPQKGPLNTSVQFIDPENSNKNEDGFDESKVNKTQTEDPLEDSNASDSSDSDNVHIQNYDSILSELNKKVKTKNKDNNGDISLNLNKKTKQKKTASIVDQLNLTATRSNKLKNKSENYSKNSDKNESNQSVLNEEDNYCDSEASESIALGLLFSEESSSSETIQSGIPIKQSHSNTNILEISEVKDSMMPDSAEKKNKKHKSASKSDENENNDDNNDVYFFLDTTGTHDSRPLDSSLNLSSSKTLEEPNTDENYDINSDSDSDTPMEVSNKSREIEDLKIQNKVQEADKSKSAAQNISINKTPKSNKKKKRNSESILAIQTDASMEKSNTSIVDIKIQDNIEETNESICAVQKKSINMTPKSDKKKKRNSEPMNTYKTDASIEVPNTSESNDIEVPDESIVHNKSTNKTPKSDKKKKRNSKSLSTYETGFTDNNEQSYLEQLKIEDKTDKNLNQSDSAKNSSLQTNSEKKKAKKHSESAVNEHSVLESSGTEKNNTKMLESSNTDVIDAPTNLSLLQTSNSETKKAKNLSESITTHDTGNITEDIEVTSSKKRKRKSSLGKDQEIIGIEAIESTSIQVAVGNQKKKRKISNNEDTENITQGTINKTEKEESNQNEREKKKPKHNQINIEIDIADKKKRSKKRKDREEDEESRMAKILKTTTTDKVLVPRLSTTLLNQLEDKPKKNHEVKKSKAISTTNFVVEEAKVRKPSNYLEESIYINENDNYPDTSESKKQNRIKIPKVLPFLPTVSTSNTGYTTNFKVNILQKQFQFVGKSSNVNNYKEDYLQNKKSKKLGTYEMYKRNRNVKMSKF